MGSSNVQFFNFRNALLLCLVLFLHFACKFSEAQLQRKEFLSGRKTLAIENQDPPKKKNTIGNKNQTKLIKPVKPTTNSTKTSLSKPIKTNMNSTKTSLSKPIKTTTNSTKTTLSKPIKPPTNSTKTNLSKPIKTTTNSTKTHLKNLTSNSNNSTLTKPKSAPVKTSPDLPKSNKTTTKIHAKSDLKPKTHDKSEQLSKPTNPKTKTQAKSEPKPQKTQNKPNTKLTKFSDIETDNEDLILEFRDLGSRFHDAIIPDLEKISTSSKAYLTKANQEISQGFKPLVGNKYAPFIASLISCIFLILPLFLLSLLYNQIRTYFSLQKILIFIQAYLSIYFAILSLSYLTTGFEPLKFFYSTSISSYVSMQIFQALGYGVYLLMQLMGLILLFSTTNGLGSKMLGLAQMVVGLAVGLHYYLAVFHRAVLYQPPKTNWKVHGIYATCFLVICLFARAERRKKAYLEESGEGDGKKS